MWTPISQSLPAVIGSPTARGINGSRNHTTAYRLNGLPFTEPAAAIMLATIPALLAHFRESGVLLIHFMPNNFCATVWGVDKP